MPRLEQIVAHIANQSASEDNLGQDALKIQAFSDALSVRSQELTTKDKRQGLSEEEEAELNSIERLQERTSSQKSQSDPQSHAGCHAGLYRPG